MKALNIILKVLAALAAVAGAVYLAATYGDRIVAWAKKLLASCPCNKCDFVEDEDLADETAEEPAEEVCENDCCCAEAPVEEPAEEPAEKAAEEPEVPAVDETAPVAEEEDFEG